MYMTSFVNNDAVLIYVNFIGINNSYGNYNDNYIHAHFHNKDMVSFSLDDYRNLLSSRFYPRQYSFCSDDLAIPNLTRCGVIVLLDELRAKGFRAKKAM